MNTHLKIAKLSIIPQLNKYSNPTFLVGMYFLLSVTSQHCAIYE